MEKEKIVGLEILDQIDIDIIPFFFRVLISVVIEDNDIHQKDIAEAIGVLPSEISKMKKGYYVERSKVNSKYYKMAIMIINNYNIDYIPLIKIANNGFIEYMKSRQISDLHRMKLQLKDELKLTGLAYNIKKDELFYIKVNIDLSNKILVFKTQKELEYLGNFSIISESLIDAELKNRNLEKIKLTLFQRITKSSYKEKKVITGEISFLRNNQIDHSQFLLLHPSLIIESHLIHETLPIYFKIPEISLAFRKGKTKRLDEILRLITDYKSHHRNVSLKLPKELTTSYKQFLDFFTDYVSIAKGIEIQFDTLKKDGSLEIYVKTNESIPINKVGEYLNEYLGFAKQNLEKLEVSIETKLNKNQFNSLVLDLKHQVTSFKHSLELTKHRLEVAKEKVDDLSQEVDYFKQLTIEFAKKDNIIHTQIIQGGEQQFSNKIKNINKMKIENQNIYGGNQQFADLIINKSQILDDTDSDFLRLINENTNSIEDKKALIKNLEGVKSSDTSVADKKKSGGILKKFFDSVASEGGKKLVQEVIENGGEYLQYIV